MDYDAEDKAIYGHLAQKAYQRLASDTSEARSVDAEVVAKYLGTRPMSARPANMIAVLERYADDE